MREAMRLADYDGLRREQAERRERGELMGIGVSFFTEAGRRRASAGTWTSWAWP
jgi:CO/xanthine dehydrogenase Mo-binding subunit